jgi:hypothetical protein
MLGEMDNLPDIIEAALNHIDGACMALRSGVPAISTLLNPDPLAPS